MAAWTGAPNRNRQLKLFLLDVALWTLFIKQIQQDPVMHHRPNLCIFCLVFSLRSTPESLVWFKGRTLLPERERERERANTAAITLLTITGFALPKRSITSRYFWVAFLEIHPFHEHLLLTSGRCLPVGSQHTHTTTHASSEQLFYCFLQEREKLFSKPTDFKGASKLRANGSLFNQSVLVRAALPELQLKRQS